MRRPAPRTLALFVLLAAAGCGLKWPDGSPVLPSSGNPAGAYVDADRLTWNAVAPEYDAYVQGDPKLTPDQKARRRRTVDTWRLRIESARANGTTEPVPPVPTTLPSLPPIP